MREYLIEEQKNYWRVPIRVKFDIYPGTWFTKTLSAIHAIKAVMGRKVGQPEGSSVIQAFLFHKDVWRRIDVEMYLEEKVAAGQLEEY